MDDSQRERMERNRETAILRLRARELGNGVGDGGGKRSISEGSELGLQGDSDVGRSEVVFVSCDANSGDALKGTSAACSDEASDDVGVGDVPRLPRVSKRPEMSSKYTQSILSSSLGIAKSCQDFDYLVAIDFEATCDNSVTLCPQEIVEFPAILVNLETRQIDSVFHTFVKPVYHPKLTEFCKRFLGIKQEQVDNGVLLGKALQMHDAWLEENNVKHKRFVVATWSDWDCRTMLESECLYKGLQKPLYFNRWINLKIPHRQIYGNVKANFKQSVELMGRKFEGRPHSGLDDAKNTAYLALELIRRGIRLRVTGWIKGHALDGATKVALPWSKKRKNPALTSK
ncbi:hypothetical protein KC19_3G212200 [Ceratodon purpureus]|uniref:Exonuclease domain-containing protein n=1 Tax=Ceratodon purpureus TaxID=3225 RepID=A0A8T0IN91_CERPU|nr:hypothetical protein KC19_3G212200 [Ceratodon purpureus]